MICSKCNAKVFRTWSYIRNGVIHSNECAFCYPDGQFNSYSKLQRLQTRSLAPDGRTVLTGRQGQRLNDLKRKAQNDSRNSTVS